MKKRSELEGPSLFNRDYAILSIFLRNQTLSLKLLKGGIK